MNKLGIGSVVGVLGTDQEIYKVMVISRSIMVDGVDGIIDYAGVIYPYGYIKDTPPIIFNQNQVEIIHHNAKQDIAEQILIKIEDKIDQLKEKND